MWENKKYYLSFFVGWAGLVIVEGKVRIYFIVLRVVLEKLFRKLYLDIYSRII